MLLCLLLVVLGWHSRGAGRSCYGVWPQHCCHLSHKELEPSSKEAVFAASAKAMLDSATAHIQCFSLMSSAFGLLHNGAVVEQAALTNKRIMFQTLGSKCGTLCAMYVYVGDLLRGQEIAMFRGYDQVQDPPQNRGKGKGKGKGRAIGDPNGPVYPYPWPEPFPWPREPLQPETCNPRHEASTGCIGLCCSLQLMYTCTFVSIKSYS